MKKQSHKKALRLSIFTVAYNVVEASVAITFGAISGSSALIGFGLDSVAESLSGSIMIWRFAQHRPKKEEDRKEKRAYQLVGYSFLILGTYVLYEAGSKLIQGEKPDQTLVGIVIALVSLLVTPILFRAKYRLGKKIGSQSLVADSKQTFACIMMSVSLLIGVSLNYFFGLWWADPLAAIFIAIMLIREGFEMKRGRAH